MIFTPATACFLAGFFLALGALHALVPSSRKRMAPAWLASTLAAGGLFVLSAAGRLGVGEGSAPLRVLHALCNLLLSVGAINALGVLAFDALLPRARIRLPALVQDLILALGYVLAGLTVLSHAGANLAGILATSAVVTAVIAFSLQDTLGNIMGGVVMQFESSFEPGDWIQVGQDQGHVKEIRWRHTTLDTGKGDLVVIPNSVLVKGVVRVLGRGGPFARPRRLRRVDFRVYYDHAPREVIGAVEAALREDPPSGAARDLPADCLLKEIKEGCAVYSAGYWLDDLSKDDSCDSAVRERVFYALSRAGIKVSVPDHAMVVVQQGDEVLERSRREEALRRVEAVQGVEIFQPLTREEIGTLAERLQSAPFAKGEMITRQGSAAHWLYIIVSGRAEVRVYSESGGSHQVVGTLGRGDFLGEMGLMTGAPRAATAVALSDVKCYRLDREGFAGVLESRPAIAEAISHILARRKVELEAARGGLDEESRKKALTVEQGNFLKRILASGWNF